MPALLASAVFAVPAADGAQQVSVLERRIIGAAELPRPPRATHGLNLTLVTFRGTRWDTPTILAAARSATSVLGACDVAVESLELRLLDAPRALHFYSTTLSRTLMREIDVPRPAIFFVEDTRSTPAFDAEAIGRGNSATRPELSDTVWIAHGSRDLAHVIAHELVHVLTDSGAHSDEPGNLMHEETSTKNVRLSAAQCTALRAKGEANGLLSRKDASYTP